MPNIKLVSDPILRKVSEQVVLFDDTLSSLLSDMHQTMVAEDGVGLAAVQIGIPLRVFILKDDVLPYKEYINPEVVFESGPQEFEEGCLSIPGVMAKVQRFNKIGLKWVDKTGTTQYAEFTGRNSLAIQHEMDHLNGKLYIDRLTPNRRDMILMNHKRFLNSRR